MAERNPIRVATALLSERIFAGRPTKDGKGFKEPRYDVTSDVLVAIRDKVGVGNEIAVGLAGTGTMFRIAVLPPEISDAAPSGGRCADPGLLGLVRMFYDKIEQGGEWDEGCFYYRGTSASDLEEPLTLARDAIGKATGK